jgi:hypothetical protein
MTIKTLHTVQFNLGPESAAASIKCHGGIDADCHELYCTRPECPEHCTCDDPQPGPANYCIPVEAMAFAGADAAECYDGPWMADVASGSPIVLTYDGESWTWKLADQSKH